MAAVSTSGLNLDIQTLELEGISETANFLEQRKRLSSLMGVFIFVATEAMFFSGLISAFLVAKARIAVWPPLGQPRLPVEATAFNTTFLLISGFTMFLAHSKESVSEKKRYLWATMASASIFLVLQGVEWIKLMNYGLSFIANMYGGFFYLIVGAHALHVLVGILALLVFALKPQIKNLTAMGLYWAFVVLLWPVIYGLVYSK